MVHDQNGKLYTVSLHVKLCVLMQKILDHEYVVSKTYAKAPLKIAYKITVYRKVLCQLVAMPN